MIAIGCDHAAVGFKNAIIEHLRKNGFDVKDYGCDGEKSVSERCSQAYAFLINRTFA